MELDFLSLRAAPPLQALLSNLPHIGFLPVCNIFRFISHSKLCKEMTKSMQPEQECVVVLRR